MHVFSPLNKRGSNTSLEAPGLLLLLAFLAANQGSNCSRSGGSFSGDKPREGLLCSEAVIQSRNNAPINSKIKENYFIESKISFGILINREPEGGKESLV